MAVIKTARLNLAKQTFRDPAWHTALDQGFDDADARLLRTGTADPNVAEEGDYVGQLYYETDATPHRIWICRVIGGPGAAVWDEVSQLIHGGQAATNIIFDNNILLQAKETGGTPRHLASIDGSNLIQYGDVNNAFEINVDSLANAKLDDGVAAKRIITEADAGHGNGFDADTLDTKHAADFLSSDDLADFLNDGSSATYFEKLDITIPDGGGAGFAHDLTTTPRMFTARFRCTSNNNGYVIDDEISLLAQGTRFLATSPMSPGAHAYVSPTHIGYSVPPSGLLPVVLAKHSGTTGGISYGDWKIDLKAWK